MIKGFHHLVLFCQDTELSRGWFERAGFTYRRGYDGMHWFALGDGEIMLHPAGTGQIKDAATVHVAVADVAAHFQAAVAAGLEPFDHQQPGVALAGPVTRPWGDRELELRDPDGYVWAFTESGD